MPFNGMSLHQLQAVLHAAHLIDGTGNDSRSTQHAYTHAVTDGTHSAEGLTLGEQFLLTSGLLIEANGIFQPTTALEALCNLDESDALDALAALAATAGDRLLKSFDQASLEDEQMDSTFSAADLERRAEVGRLGEELVLSVCRAELVALGRTDLADRVQQVSLISDALGYDIVAPRVAGQPRHIEVKAQAAVSAHKARFFLSRNEYEVGRRQKNWSLVCCSVGSDGRIVGWCAADTLAAYLPTDGNGRWTQALVTVPVSALLGGIPAPI